MSQSSLTLAAIRVEATNRIYNITFEILPITKFQIPRLQGEEIIASQIFYRFRRKKIQGKRREFFSRPVIRWNGFVAGFIPVNYRTIAPTSPLRRPLRFAHEEQQSSLFPGKSEKVSLSRYLAIYIGGKQEASIGQVSR